MEGGEGGTWVRYDLSLSGSGTSPGEKRRLIRVSDGTGPQDPGGSEAQLTPSRDVAVARSVFQPMSQPVFVRSEEVGVSAVMVTVGVASLADAEMVTVGVTELADVGAASWPMLGWRSQPTLLGLSP